jgi:uncharacterized protein (TIGR01777 family)
MKILIAGCSGFIGTALTSYLQQHGHEVFLLVRKEPSSSHEIRWDPVKGKMDPWQLEGLDAVINLAGENIASHRWSAKRKQSIKESRLRSTELLCQMFRQIKKSPKVWVNASAIGYYGDRGDFWLDEESLHGKGFLAEVCSSWESAAKEVEKLGIRLIRLRIGMVLGDKGGALPKMVTPFKLGLGGVIGSGNQYMSWITLSDLLAIFLFGLTSELQGAVNAVSPNPVTNREFTKTLGEKLHRPTLFSLPAWAARLLFGEMAQELLLSSARVLPKKLLDSGFAFHDPILKDALDRL